MAAAAREGWVEDGGMCGLAGYRLDEDNIERSMRLPLSSKTRRRGCWLGGSLVEE